MAAHDASRSDRIRDLIEEVDRVRRESEQVRSHVDKAMKQPFWPERRRHARVPGSESHRHDGHNDAA